MHKHEYAEICKKKYAEICKKYANICICPMSLPQLHIYAKICKKYAKYASMKFICIICTPHFADDRVDAARFELRLPIGLRLARGCFSQSGRGCWRGSSKSPSGQPAHRKSRPINYFISTMRPIMRLLWGESVLILCLLAVGAQALPTAKQALLHHPQSAKTLRLSGGSPAPLLTKRTVFNAAIGLLGIEVGKPEHHCLHSA